MSKITIEKLHEVTLPPEKKKSVKIDFVSYYLWRPICDRISIWLMPTNITPTAVTVFSFWSSILSLLFFILLPNKFGALLGYLAIWLWNIADGIDGNIARYKRLFSKSGDLWDATAGYMAMVAFYLGSGIVASNEKSILIDNLIDSKYYILMGAISAICTIFPRLIVQKKNVVYGDAAVKKLKNKATYTFSRIILLNITSINGLAGILLLISILFNIVNLFTICYLLVQLMFFTASMITVMKDL